MVPMAHGRILEVGMGSGLNLPFYDASKIDQVLGLEPLEQMRNASEKYASNLPFKVEFIGLSGESIPLENQSIDTVLVTFSLCSIPNIYMALHEMRRVLKPSGKLIFCEHGRSPEEHILKWQNRLDRPWSKISGGCHLNRNIAELIDQSGYRIIELDTGYINPFKLLSFTYKGVAVAD